MASPSEFIEDDGCSDNDKTQSTTENIMVMEAYNELMIDAMTEDDGNRLIIVDDLVTHIRDHYSKQEIAQDAPKSQHSLFQRLVSGNMSTSHKKKCENIVTKGVAHGASSVPKSSLKKLYHKTTTFIPSSGFSPEDICKCILERLLEINCQSLVQEKWLAETSRMLEKKILTIGVFGRHKAGKSTVLNALLQQEILPSAVTNETAFLTKIYHDKSKHISGCEDCSKENCQNCPTWGKISGRRKVRHQLQDINKIVRKEGKPLQEVEQNAVIACVPFVSPYKIGDIQIVIMDTPGLAEANELGITDIAEHHLMTCSVYIYVISCTQLEDEIDTETLRAIAERDPGVFDQKRILIVVTRLDEYEEARKRNNDSSDDKHNSGDEKEHDFQGLIFSIKQLVKRQFKSVYGSDIPDDAIIPVSATGALEARKEKSGLDSEDIEYLLLKFKKRVGKRITFQELEEYSQVPLLENCLGDIVLRAYPVWKHAIVRDCSRYLQTAIKSLQVSQEAFEKVGNDFAKKLKSKVMKWKEFKERGKFFKAQYQRDSKFHESLESAYESDIASLQSSIEEKCESEYKFFEESIKQKKYLTSEEYREQCEEFLEKANKSLMSDFAHLQFQKVNTIIKRAYFRLGEQFKELEDLMVTFCGTKCITMSDNEKSVQSRTNAITIDEAPVKTAPLELKDLLAHGKSVDYTMLDKMRIFMQRIFLRITYDDPNRRLLDKERDALLLELKLSLLQDSNKYFVDIKTEIINGYIEEQMASIDNHITELKRRYVSGIDEITGKVKFWHDKSENYKTISDGQKEEIEFLKQLQIKLEPMFR